MREQESHQRRRQVEHTSGFLGFDRCDLEPRTKHDNLLLDAEAMVDQVHVRPAQPQKLAPPQPRGDQYMPDGMVMLIYGSDQEALLFLLRPNPVLLRSRLWRVDEPRHIARYQLPAERQVK